MLSIHPLNGQNEPLVDYELPSRRWVLNGEYTLNFGIYESLSNTESFDLIEGEAIVECDNDYFRVKQVDKRLVGNNRYKNVACLHVINDLERARVYTSQTGSISINQAMAFITSGTNFTYTIDGTFASVSFESFGNADCMTLFKKILDEFQAEYQVSKYHITLKNRVGADNDFQFRYRYNMTAVSEQCDTNSLRTFIKGSGKKDTNGVPLVTAEYESPNAAIYGRLHADPIEDERFTSSTSLQDYIKANLEDTPKVAYKFDYRTVVNEIGQNIGRGDAGWVIHEKLGIDIYARVVEIQDYPGIDKDPVVTIGNVLLNGTQEIIKRVG